MRDVLFNGTVSSTWESCGDGRTKLRSPSSVLERMLRRFGCSVGAAAARVRAPAARVARPLSSASRIGGPATVAGTEKIARIAHSPRVAADAPRPRPLPVTSLATPRAAAAKEVINVTFVKPTGEKVTVKAPVGDSMLEVAHANKIDIEGACARAVARWWPRPCVGPERRALPRCVRSAVLRYRSRDLNPCRRLRRRDSVLHVPRHRVQGAV